MTGPAAGAAGGAAAGAGATTGTVAASAGAGAAAGTTAAVGGTAAAVGGTTAAASISFGTGVYAGAVAGAASSLASQAVGSMMGVTSFNWRGVIVGGVTGAITGGMFAQWGSVGQAVEKLQYGRAAGLALGGAGASYIGQKVAGMDVSFSWRGITADALSSLVSAQISKSVGLPPSKDFQGAGNFGADLANGMIGGVVSVHTRRAFGFNDEIHYGRIALDAFGNALGNVLGNAMALGVRDVRATRGLKDASRGAYDELRKAGYSPEQARRIVTDPDMQGLLAARDDRDALARSENNKLNSFDDLSTEEKENLLTRQSRGKYPLKYNESGVPYSLHDANPFGIEIDVFGGDPFSTKSTLHSFAVAASGVIVEGQAALGSAIETLGEDNVRGAVIVTQFALGGIPKTIVGLATEQIAGEWINQKIDKYIKTPLSDAYAKGIFGAVEGDEVAAVRPVSDSAAAFTIGLASTVAVGIGASMGRDMIIGAARNAKAYIEVAKNKLEVVVRDRMNAAKEVELFGPSGSGPKNTYAQIGALGDIDRLKILKKLSKGTENFKTFDSFNSARQYAKKLSGLGDDSVDFIQEIGPNVGRVTGRMSPDGARGWRIDFDEEYGFHVNWWDRTGGRKRPNWYFGLNLIEGGTEAKYIELLRHFPEN